MGASAIVLSVTRWLAPLVLALLLALGAGATRAGRRSSKTPAAATSTPNDDRETMEWREQQVDVAIEWTRCFVSFAYFLNFVTIEDVQRSESGTLEGGGPVAYKLWDHLLTVANDWQGDPRTQAHGGNFVEGKARQLGYSWLAAAYSIWTISFKSNARVLVISIGKRESQEFLRKCTVIHRHLPYFLKIPIDTINRETLKLEETEGEILALPSTENAGSGFQATIVITDEWAKHPFAGSNFSAYRPTIADGGQHIAISTGWGSVGMYHDYFVDAVNGKNGYGWHFYGWRSKPNRTDEWYEQERLAYVSSGRGEARFTQENPETWEQMFAGFEGLVYRSYDPAIHKSLPPFLWETADIRVVGVDPAQGDPAAILMIGVKDGFAFVFDEWIEDGLVTEPRIAAVIQKWHRRAPLHGILVDPTEGILIATLQARGLPAMAAYRDKDAGIGVVQSFLEAEMFAHAEHLERLPREFTSYEFKQRTHPGESAPYTTNTPADHHGDALDCLRYALVAVSMGMHDIRAGKQPDWRLPDPVTPEQAKVGRLNQPDPQMVAIANREASGDDAMGHSPYNQPDFRADRQEPVDFVDTRARPAPSVGGGGRRGDY